ncbi:hypothetical protein TNCV_592651 [Trichonephila clavipes]|nr:hypothetical protein TNCV_592651 [Trichonephila clavipes]
MLEKLQRNCSHLLVFNIRKEASHLVWRLKWPLNTRHARLYFGWTVVRRYISGILYPVIVSYLQGLTNARFQQDNTGSHVARHVLTFLDTQGIRLSPCPSRSLDLPPIVNIFSWIAKRLAHHRSLADTVDDVWHRFKVA